MANPIVEEFEPNVEVRFHELELGLNPMKHKSHRCGKVGTHALPVLVRTSEKDGEGDRARCVRRF